MKGFDQLNKAFESRVRLGLMSILSVNSWVSYKEIKDLLEVTDGNLASHVQSLEKIKYLEIKKQFIGKKPLTTYKVTKMGKEAFEKHIEGLEKLLLK
ncbi:MAG: transcriptional regulator [Bacteroidota bacterium]|mgnify:FL=1|nr:transcriptional regulator [Bacteroidota bacterium]GIR58282.1 MAG: transcriptional regulator [Crocinitomicaceae bacterium]MEC7128273.1 transcriptional regulator [Bacteroidota bacterium]MEC7619078.1 transcriptional regulator [Bacteroidota bacterium]MEC7937144.1 transcriptional regulator [Bacteroidota bacterium]|tara:strand:- start:717 stop:1007 length:291 start_codon:yes stop_codon:yes gene_type:complete